MTKDNIDVLVVDDSKVTRQLLVHILESDPQIRVVGALTDGQAAVDFVALNCPGVVLMDIHMPGMDGFEATRRIMETQPVPIIICSATTDPKEVATTFRSMEAGAVSFVEKPAGPESANFAELVANLLQTVKLMSEVKVVRRWPRLRSAVSSTPAAAGESKSAATGIRFIGIGASTGGPPVLQTILSSLPKDLPVPVLIVQHIARGFLPGLAEWLGQTTGWQIHLAAHGTTPLPGHAYLAPDDFHMGVTPSGRIFLTREQPENGLRPAVSFLFRSLAEAFGSSILGVLLTGMGKDGAAELKLLKDRGAVTIAQDRESSIVHGMPGEAILLGGATHVLAADKIAETLVMLVNREKFSGEITR
ncbi:MAG: chemotaxis-specific protein-glutamate methyltransferase CheB [Chthoniobacter sp.]|nr:chemotaxis-specific protein-glutamate methyltransferase CheB [Chthoniobacter sp.]